MPAPGITWIAALRAAASGRMVVAQDESAEPWPRWQSLAATGKRFVTCHSLADGSLVWNREILGPIDGHHAQNRSASGSVAVDDAGFYWMWAARDGLRVEAWTLDSRPKWHVDLGPDVAEYGFGTSATICGDVLIVPNDQEGESFVVALQTAGGRERWRLPRESGKSGYSTPLCVGRRLYLWGDRGVVTCVDSQTGEVWWRGRVGGTFSVSPIAVGGTVRNVSADGEAVTIAESDSFEVLGRTPLGEQCRATPAIACGRMVFRTTGRLLALDADEANHPK